jgi:hypothetical protein
MKEGPLTSADQVVDPKPPRAAVVLKSPSPLSSRAGPHGGVADPQGALADEASKQIGQQAHESVLRGRRKSV